MTVQVQIRPEVETRLLARAHSMGESLELFIQHLLEREASGSAVLAADRNGSQRAEAFRAWAKSFPTNMPLLALEDISRDKIYEQD